MKDTIVTIQGDSAICTTEALTPSTKKHLIEHLENIIKTIPIVEGHIKDPKEADNVQFWHINLAIWQHKKQLITKLLINR